MTRIFFGMNALLVASSEIELRKKLNESKLFYHVLVAELLLDKCEFDETGVYVDIDSGLLGFRQFTHNVGGDLVEIEPDDMESENYLIEDYAEEIFTAEGKNYWIEKARIGEEKTGEFLELCDCGNTAFFVDNNIMSTLEKMGVHIKRRASNE